MLHPDIEFLVCDGNAGYNQIFMDEEDISKMAFICLGFVSLFEWVVMTFGLKNAGATYQRAMNLIFHDFLGMIVEVYIDDIVVKLAGENSHLADLILTFEENVSVQIKDEPTQMCFWFIGWEVLGLHCA
jgi:hypothetical protein